MSLQLDSSTGTTESKNVKCDIPTAQTCNCCPLLVDCSTWNHLKSMEDSSNEEVVKGTTTSMSCRISFTCRLLHHLPTMSVLSHWYSLWGPRTIVILRLRGGARGQQHLDHLQVAARRRIYQRPVASVWRALLMMATGRAKSHELLRRISQDFGSEKLAVWSTISN